MNKNQLLELIENGENSRVEFKLDDVRPEQLAKECVAILNLRGGKILLGVGDDGTVTGIQRKDLEHWIMDTVFGHYIHPMIVPDYEEIPIDESRRVAVITLSQGFSKPYVVRDRKREDIYIRLGSTSRTATREQLVRLFALGGMLNADLLPVSGSKFADFSQDRLRDYMSSILKNDSIPMNEPEWRAELCQLGFMAEREYDPEVASIAGLVLFGNSPKRRLPQAGIRWMAFDGNDKSYSALDDRVIDGPLVPLQQSEFQKSTSVVGQGIIDSLIDSMTPFISAECEELEDSLRRVRSWCYPVTSIREVVVNAVAHRDWTRNEEIEIVRYKNRIEVLSPGSLPNTMTVGKMIAGRRSPRNQLIVSVLRDYGYVDARGMGVHTKVIPQMKAHNGTEPEFIATDDYLKVVLHR